MILVSEHMLMALHRLSKLLALSVPIKDVDDDKFKIGELVAEYVVRLDADVQLQSYWCEFFVDYTLHPTNPPSGALVRVPTNQRTTLMNDFHEAMLCFVVGHEYGHHIAAHGLGAAASATGPDREVQHKQEIDADMIGALLTMKVGDSRDNFFALANVGAVLVLKVLELFRLGSTILSSGAAPTKSLRETHPDLELRIQAVRAPAKVHMPEHSFITTIRLQTVFEGLLDHVWNACRPRLEDLHKQGYRPVISKQTGWLPF